jgi:hypothetical protein
MLLKVSVETAATQPFLQWFEAASNPCASIKLQDLANLTIEALFD